MKSTGPHAVRKHSVTIAGHRTSLSLEAAFWDRLKAIARQRGQSVNGLIREIDRTRAEHGAEINLSSAVRVYVLDAVDPARRGTARTA